MGILKKKKYSVRTFHTYLARCSLSIAKLLCFFFLEKYFFSDFVFVLDFLDSFRENRKLLEARWLPHRSWNLRRLSGSRLRVQCARASVRACVYKRACVRLRAYARACVRLPARITFGSMFR